MTDLEFVYIIDDVVHVVSVGSLWGHNAAVEKPLVFRAIRN